MATDYPDVVGLLEGAPEIRQVFHLPSPRLGAAPSQIDGLTDQTYDVATFTTWSATLRDRMQARSVHVFERGRWLVEGDSRSVERIARSLGWPGELPAPFAMTSNRRFDLPPGTVAIHPGCKYEWPWKKWHGFSELARLFANVVVVGTEEDLRAENTYFTDASMAGASPQLCWKIGSSRYGRLAPRVCGADFQRFRLNASGGGPGHPNIRHFRNHQSGTRDDFRTTHVSDYAKASHAKPPAARARGAGAIATIICAV